MTITQRLRFAVLLAALILTSCNGGSGTAAKNTGLPPVTPPDLATFKLQFAVGTATIVAQNGTAYVGLNTVETFRQSNGLSATTSNTPTLTAPAGSGLFAGADSISGITIAQIVQIAGGAKIDLTTFGLGPLIGAFGYGLTPANLLPQTATSAVYPGNGCKGPVSDLSATNVFGGEDGYDSLRFNTLQLPIGAANQAGLNLCGPAFSPAPPRTEQVEFYGGPPAWPSPVGFGLPPGFRGYPAGFTDFSVTPVPGTYSLGVTFPSDDSGLNYATYNASSTLSPAAIAKPLPAFATPTLNIQGDGGGIVSINVPSGVAEAIVFIYQSTQCTKNPQAQSNSYALVTHQTGPQVLTLSNLLGQPDAGGNPTHTFCTVPDGQLHDNYEIVAVGFDYPAFEGSYPQSTAVAPAITNGDGHSGTADITVSQPFSGSAAPPP